MALNYTPISSESELPAALKQIDQNFRQIAAENQTKTISQNGGTALRYGLLGDGTYGLVTVPTALSSTTQPTTHA